MRTTKLQKIIYRSEIGRFARKTDIDLKAKKILVGKIAFGVIIDALIIYALTLS